MERRGTTQSEKGQVSAQATEPKDKQNTFTTQEERDLAARFEVEPKLVRLLNEIVKERLQLLNENIDERLVAPKQTVAEPEQEEESQPSTGIPALDDLIEDASYEAVALAYACLQLYPMDMKLGGKIREMLRSTFEVALKAHNKNDSQFDLECDLLPAIKWHNFLQGFMAGRGLVEI